MNGFSKQGLAVACALMAGLVATASRSGAQEKKPQGMAAVRAYEKTQHVSENVEEKDDVVFGKGVNGPLMANITMPKDRKGLMPGIMMVHGGGWHGGGRKDRVLMASGLADRGYICISIDYDLAPPAHYPTQLEQTWAAWIYFHDHAKDFGVDPDRLGILGNSAGGELATLVGLGVRRPAGAPLPKVVVLYSGALDLAEEGGNMVVTNYLGKTCADLHDLCIEASPARASLKGAPPFYVGYGTDDHSVPPHQQTDFIAKLKAAGVPVEVYVAKGGPHTYSRLPQWAQANVDATIHFLDKYLK